MKLDEKNRSRKKGVLILGLLFLIIGIMVTSVYLKKKGKNDAEHVELSNEVTLRENQRLVYGEIKSIQGNEMIYIPMEEDTKQQVDSQPSKELDDKVSKKAEVKIMIPVGTEVVTKLGTTTTFARLAVGDMIQILMEKSDTGEEIVKLWIVE